MMAFSRRTSIFESSLILWFASLSPAVSATVSTKPQVALPQAVCDQDVVVKDAMEFYDKNGTTPLKSILVPKSCSEFKIKLKNMGKAPKNVMGHNFVLTTKEDSQATLSEAWGLKDQDYLPKRPVVAGSKKTLGPGEEEVILIKDLKPGVSYTYFCTFPGHGSGMQGTLLLDEPQTKAPSA